jgi:hypothetical protein
MVTACIVFARKEREMAVKVGNMTKNELKEMIESIIEQKFSELLVDPDAKLSLRKTIRDRLMQQREAVANGERGEALEQVARRLRLE